MPDWLQALMPGIAAGLVAWGAVRVELRYMRRDINAAHMRLDKIKAPGAWMNAD